MRALPNYAARSTPEWLEGTLYGSSNAAHQGQHWDHTLRSCCGGRGSAHPEPVCFASNLPLRKLWQPCLHQLLGCVLIQTTELRQQLWERWLAGRSSREGRNSSRSRKQRQGRGRGQLSAPQTAQQRRGAYATAHHQNMASGTCMALRAGRGSKRPTVECARLSCWPQSLPSLSADRGMVSPFFTSASSCLVMSALLSPSTFTASSTP